MRLNKFILQFSSELCNLFFITLHLIFQMYAGIFDVTQKKFFRKQGLNLFHYICLGKEKF